MVKLLISSMATPQSLLSRIHSTDAATIQSVLDDAQAIAATRSPATVTVTPTIISHSDGQDEADRINQINQAVIGAKEGVTEAFTKKVGSAITDKVLCTANGTDYKSIDDYELHELVTTAKYRRHPQPTCGHPLLPIRLPEEVHHQLRAPLRQNCEDAFIRHHRQQNSACACHPREC
jgi:hypothetical protein